MPMVEPKQVDLFAPASVQFTRARPETLVINIDALVHWKQRMFDYQQIRKVHFLTVRYYRERIVKKDAIAILNSVNLIHESHTRNLFKMANISCH